MKESNNPHLKVQELCDCYAEADPLKEMSDIIHEPVTEEAAMKWLALAILHGINSSAKKITLTQENKGPVEITAKYRTAHIPSPGDKTGAQILALLRTITHLDADKGKRTLAFGFRENSMELEVKIKKEDNSEKITIHFPGDS